MEELNTLDEYVDFIKEKEQLQSDCALEIGRALSEAKVKFFDTLNGSNQTRARKFNKWAKEMLDMPKLTLNKNIQVYERFKNYNAGHLGVAKLQILVRFPSTFSNEELIEKAENMTVRQLRTWKKELDGNECKTNSSDLHKNIVLKLLQEIEKDELLSIIEECEDELDTGYVYFIQVNGLTKIGMTSCLDERIYKFNINWHTKPELLFSIESNRYKSLEKELHERFKDLRTNGEFFNLSFKQLVELQEEFKDVIFS